jgi:hypothetical protein
VCSRGLPSYRRRRFAPPFFFFPARFFAFGRLAPFFAAFFFPFGLAFFFRFGFGAPIGRSMGIDIGAGAGVGMYGADGIIGSIMPGPDQPLSGTST